MYKIVNVNNKTKCLVGGLDGVGGVVVGVDVLPVRGHVGLLRILIVETLT